jgi:hypothetical protein
MLLKTTEDFKNYTLGALPTLVAKLAYVSSLQDEDGRYTHWGLSRSFGDQKAQKAIRAAHSELALDVLRRPIRGLYFELQSAHEQQQVEPSLMRLTAPAHDDELISAHVRLVQESLVAVAARAVPSQSAA